MSSVRIVCCLFGLERCAKTLHMVSTKEKFFLQELNGSLITLTLEIFFFKLKGHMDPFYLLIVEGFFFF